MNLAANSQIKIHLGELNGAECFASPLASLKIQTLQSNLFGCSVQVFTADHLPYKGPQVPKYQRCPWLISLC